MSSDYDKLLELAKRRRSIRRYKPDPIPDGDIEKIVEVARWSMSGANGQPWEFIVVKDANMRAKIYEIYKKHRRFVDVMERTRIEDIRQPITGALDEGFPLFKDAPAVIVICGDPRSLQATVLAAQIVGGERETFHMNMANATTMVHLAAASLGLGTQWVTTTVHFEQGLKELLGIPQIYKVPQIVPVGYPDYTPHGAWRKKLGDIIHNEKYDLAKYRSDEDVVADIVALRKRMKANYRPPSETGKA